MQKSSLPLLLLLLLISACSPKNPVEKTDAVLFIDPSQIRVEGDLQTRLMKNFDRLEEGKYQPDSVFMSEEASNWWPGDKEGRTILALTKLARATGREPKYLDTIIKLLPDKVNAKGYFGTIYPDSVFDEQQLSSHGWMLRGLCEYYLWKKDADVLASINRIVDNLVLPTKGFHAGYPIDPSLRKQGGHQIGNRIIERVGNWILSTDIGCDFIFMDGVVQAYQVTHREELKPLIDEMIALFRKIDLVQIKAQTHASLTGLRALLRYYQSTGDPSLVQTVEKDFNLYLKYARTENYENYNWFGRPEWTEPCAVIDSYILSSWLWQLTGKPEYAANAQLIYYNAISFEQRANGGFGTDNCSGSNSAFLHPDLNEAYWCCTMRGGEGLAAVALNQFFTSDQSVSVLSFENASIDLRFKDDSLVLIEKTAYPFQGGVIFEVKGTSLTFDPRIRLLAPSWINDPEIFINGKKMNSDLENGFICFSAKLNKGDQINYAFTLKSFRKGVENPNSMAGYHKYFSGPLLLGQVGNEKSPLTPVYHLLDPQVKKETGYQIQILFKKE